MSELLIQTERIMINVRELIYNNIGPAEIQVQADPDQLPGIRDFRVSLVSACNLHCEHCHNEGQPPPWMMMEQGEQTMASVEELIALIELAAQYQANTVKFTGGEPSLYPHFAALMKEIAARDWGNLTFGIATNGLPFLPAKKLQELIDSPLSRANIGLDSIRDGEKSKPSSPVGVEGRKLFEEMIVPLWHAWRENGKQVIINTVFTGDEARVAEILERARAEGIVVNIIEINGVMDNEPETRLAFLNFLAKTAAKYGLHPEMDPILNQTYLCDDEGKQVFRFYQDHCADQDCGHCRNIHVRVNSTSEGLAIIPCFLQDQGGNVPITTNGQIDEKKFQRGLEVSGTGPNWKELEQERKKSIKSR